MVAQKTIMQGEQNMPIGNDKEVYTALSKSGKVIVMPKLIISIANCAFKGNQHIEKMNFTNVQVIGGHAFKDCRKLYSVSFSNCLFKVGISAFADCHKLTQINLPDSVVKIEDSAFVGCPIKEMILPKRLSYLGYNVFCGCRSLERVVFPDGIKEIKASQKLFENCDSLSEIEVCADCNIENGSVPENCLIIYRNS